MRASATPDTNTADASAAGGPLLKMAFVRPFGSDRGAGGKVRVGPAPDPGFDGRGGDRVDLLLRAHHQSAGELLGEAEADPFPGDGGLQQQVGAKRRHEQGEAGFLRGEQMASQELLELGRAVLSYPS